MRTVIKIRLLGILFLFPFALCAQERPILDWNFFRQDRPNNAPHQAFTWGNLSYRYKPLKVDGDRIDFQFDVVLKMDTLRSYFMASKRFKEDRLLKHEQGHADILYIAALKLKDTFAKSTFSVKNYQSEIRKIWDFIYGEMNAEQLRYDEETNHSMNADAQEKWNRYLEASVKR